jgi:hypothetical protein
LREILERLARGLISIDDAERLLKLQYVAEIENVAKLDVNREQRKGIAEIVLAEGKEADDLRNVVTRMLKERGRVIISRASKEQIELIKTTVPQDSTVQINHSNGMVVVKRGDFQTERKGGKIGILTAGTSDIPVAEEARIVAEEMGCEVLVAYDVGVAGLHRLLPSLREMITRDLDVVIVVAGREGALPSVVAGFVDAPIIAVPTSIGYGLGEKGLGALSAMLQACSLGIAVVNIDAGVAAGAVAVLIANRAAKQRRRNLGVQS